MHEAVRVVNFDHVHVRFYVCQYFCYCVELAWKFVLSDCFVWPSVNAQSWFRTFDH